MADSTYLDEQVEVSKVIVAAGGRVAPHDVFAVNLGRDGDVLANGQTQDIFGVGQSEPIAVQKGTRKSISITPR